jgi:hypothetical protein
MVLRAWDGDNMRMVFITPKAGGPPSRHYRGLPFAASGVGDWLGERLTDEPWLFGTIPQGFEAYARVFHPPYRQVGEAEQPSMFAPHHLAVDSVGERAMVYMRELRWAQIAAANNRVAHPTMEWAAITGDWAYRYGHSHQPGLWNIAPSRGSLDLRPLIRLCELLAQHTGTPSRCCFGVSTIYGDVPDQVRRGAPLVAQTHVLSGPLFALPSTSLDAHRHRSPNLWWLADHAWCVVSDYDLQVTHIAGSQVCIDQLVNDLDLEVLQIDPTKPTTDEINPEPSGTYQG